MKAPALRQRADVARFGAAPTHGGNRRHVRAHHPEVVVYALRLDRGLSPPAVLRTVPGERWDEERGLTDHHYIVPGAGGLGEIMNNSFV